MSIELRVNYQAHKPEWNWTRLIWSIIWSEMKSGWVLEVLKERIQSIISVCLSKLGHVDVPTLSSTVPLAHPSITSEPSMHFYLPCLKYLTWSIYHLSILSTLHLPSPFHSATHSPAYLASPTRLSSYQMQCWDENTAFPIYFPPWYSYSFQWNNVVEPCSTFWLL